MAGNRGSLHNTCILGKQMWFLVCSLEFLEPECLFYVIYSKTSSVDFRTFQHPKHNSFANTLSVGITQDIVGKEDSVMFDGEGKHAAFQAAIFSK